MKLAAPACCLIVLFNAVAGIRADQTDSAIVAAMKLSSSPNYSWTTTTDQGSHSTEIQGKTNDSGYSLVTFKGYTSSGSSSGGRSTSGSGSGGETNAVFLGDSKYVVQTDDGWTSPGSLPAVSAPSGNGSRGTGGGGLSGTGGGMPGLNIGGTGRRGGNRGSRNSGNQDSGTGVSSRLPAGINLPHEELAIIVANYTDLHFDGDVVSGTLTQTGADLLLVPPGSSDTPPEGSSGTFRLWIKDGAVTKYELKFSAKTGPGGRAVKGGFSETITVELKDVGSTTFDVPEAAKQRLTG
jgi:hypothetical protein